MAVPSSSASKSAPAAKEQKQGKRTKSPGVRVIHGRIYDSENGKTCHQCRQKTRDFSAACKNQKKEKQCTIKYCHKCLLNRYGEKAEDMELLDDWNCPKCRGICNCSFCMKKRGHRPTGQLVYTAKATGFSSVSEMLQVKGPDNLSNERKIAKDMIVSPKKSITPKKESAAASLRKPGKENSFHVNCNSNFNSPNLTPIMNEKKSKKVKREGLKEISSTNGDDDVSLRKKTSKKQKISKEIAQKGKPMIYEEHSEKKKLKVSSEISTSKKPKASEENFKKEVKIKQNDNEKRTPKKPKINEEIDKREKSTIHEEISKKKELKVSDKICKTKKPKISVEIFNKELMINENGAGGLEEGKTCLAQVSRNDSLNVITKEGRRKANSVNITVSNGVKEDNRGQKIRADSCGVNKCTAELQDKNFAADIQLPQGSSLTTVAGVEITPEAVGHALQFLEFCAAFGKVLGLKKGQADCIVKELICGRSRRRGQYFLPIVQIHIKLLSLIQEDMGEKSPSLSPTNGKNSWLQALKKCVSESKCANDIPSDCFNSGGDGYDELDSSKKLKLLNFLCDEALGTTSLRSWIDDQNSQFVEKMKQAKENVVAAKDKEKRLKQQLQDEVAKAIIAKNGATLSISEHKALVSQIKCQAAQAHSEMLGAMGMLPKKRQRSDAVRTEPISLDDNGHAFWRLKGYSGEPDILRQDFEGTWDAVTFNEKWFAYDADQKPVVEKYISSLRVKENKVQKVSDTLQC